MNRKSFSSAFSKALCRVIVSESADFVNTSAVFALRVGFVISLLLFSPILRTINERSDGFHQNHMSENYYYTMPDTNMINPNNQVAAPRKAAAAPKKKNSLFRLFLACLLILTVFLTIGGTAYFLNDLGIINIPGMASETSAGSRKGKQKAKTDGGSKSLSGAGSAEMTVPVQGDLTGCKVILDPGHGGRDTGCVFPFNNPKYDECDFNLRIAEQVKAELEARGAVVYMTRTDNEWVSLYNRIAQTHLICMDIAKEQGILPFSAEREAELRAALQESIDINEDSVASGGMGLMVGSGVGEDLQELMEMEYELEDVFFLAIHLNSNESRTLHGTQIYYVTDASVIQSERNQMRTNSEFQRSDFPIRDEYYGRFSERSETLSYLLYDSIVGEIPEFDTNAHQVLADNYAVLREHGLTGALIEVAFLSDDNDRAILLQDGTNEKVATGIANALEYYMMQE